MFVQPSQSQIIHALTALLLESKLNLGSSSAARHTWCTLRPLRRCPKDLLNAATFICNTTYVQYQGIGLGFVSMENRKKRQRNKLFNTQKDLDLSFFPLRSSILSPSRSLVNGLWGQKQRKRQTGRERKRERITQNDRPPKRWRSFSPTYQPQSISIHTKTTKINTLTTVFYHPYIHFALKTYTSRHISVFITCPCLDVVCLSRSLSISSFPSRSRTQSTSLL